MGGTQFNSNADRIRATPDGRIRVLAHIRATNRDGALVWEDTVTHTYTFESDGKVRSTEIGKPG